MDLDKSALEVKLKHAQNQIDVEMKKRHRAETDFQHLEQQMQLICDVLMHDGQSYTYRCWLISTAEEGLVWYVLLVEEFIQVVKHFEECRKKWLHTELELMKCRDRVFKMDLDKSALEVKLKHAPNQIDVEMKKRHRAETDFQHLEQQMQLICDVLMHDGQSYTYRCWLISTAEEGLVWYVLLVEDILDDDDGTLAIYKAIQELPQPNKDTLAFLILHLQW
ncbi:UNVERIFIED_CONTAM: hypothetical protein FKN15_069328 [Acipenser sinensis]